MPTQHASDDTLIRQGPHQVPTSEAMLLSVYGDESSDEKKRRVFAVAGVIGTDEDWLRLEARWVERTRGRPFHANNCDSDRGDYVNTPHAENKALYRDLTSLLAGSGLGGWGFAIDLAASREVFPDAPDIAFYRCFMEVVTAMKQCAANNGRGVRFTFDSRQESEHNTGMLYGMLRDQPGWKNVLAPSIAFACSRDYPKVQVADLFARETMKVLDNALGPVKRPPRKSWLALYNTERFYMEAIRHGLVQGS